MREITSHLVNPDNRKEGADAISVFAVDAPGAGGANHYYIIRGAERAASNPSYCTRFDTLVTDQHVMFQHGGIPDNGNNGITNEALLAIVGDRLAAFQAGPFNCEENHQALQHVMLAMAALHRRTLDRRNRGVEGKTEQ